MATGVEGVPGNRVRMMDIYGDGYADHVVFASPEEFPDGQPKSCKKTSDCGGYCEGGTKASCESGKCKCQKLNCEKTSDCLDACPDNKTFYCSPESHACKCYKPAGFIPFYPDQDCKTAKDCTQGCETDIDFGFECTDGRCACRKAASDKWTKDRYVPEDDYKAECSGYELAQCLVTPEDDEWVCACTKLTDPKSKTKRDAPNEPVSYLRNTRKLSVRAGDGNWESPITIAPGVSEIKGSVHFAKFNKDAFPDYLVVTHSSTPNIGIYQGTGTLDKENSLRLADLDGKLFMTALVDILLLTNMLWRIGDEKDDYIVVRSDGSVDAWLNKGANNLKPLANLAAPNNRDITANKVHFADVNAPTGDGKADYLVIWDGGSVDGYINTGNLNKDGSKRNWEPSHTITPGLNGVTGDKIRFADVNGDGKADLCVLYNGGAVEAYLNTGVLNKDPSKRSWRPLPGVFAEGVNGVPGSKVRLADLDGDGLADYLVLYDGGAADAFHNTGNLAADPSARNFDDWGTVAGGVNGVSGAQVRFADLTGDGKVDYVVINKDGSIDLIKNKCRD
ncbi:hypothetical protein FQN53_001022 [Emmonsiellopsis sp. PD_33]|nr:hypothetical protein FQN53_001022 [Emmonsiellopsis sp. PD_33]